MAKLDTNTKAFLALGRAGLWETEVRLSCFGDIDFNEVFRIAQEQAVVGLVAAGLEHVVEKKVPKEAALLFVGETLQLEQRNAAMNKFISELFEKIQDAGIFALLIKGQGIAQCYKRPLWRACGDIDLFMNGNNYQKAKSFMLPFASSFEDEYEEILHLGMTIEKWIVELHGTMKTCSLSLLDKVIDNIQEETFTKEQFRIWKNGDTKVYLPNLDNDVVFVFSHIVKHFFHGGIGLRQICDWCRLLWCARNEIDKELLGKRIREAEILTEWKAFAALAVERLGMPAEAMPLYSDSIKWSNKADKVLSFILKTGNFGCNREPFSEGTLNRKISAAWRLTHDFIQHTMIFPKDSLNVWLWELNKGLMGAFKK